MGDKLWICECGAGRLIEFDPSVDKVLRKVTFTQSGFVIPNDRLASQGDAVTTEEDVMWLLDAVGGTITPVDPPYRRSGIRARPSAPGGSACVWIRRPLAGGRRELGRVSLDNGRQPRTIEMPVGLVAGSVGLDEPADVVWVSTCVPARRRSPTRPIPAA